MVVVARTTTGTSPLTVRGLYDKVRVVRDDIDKARIGYIIQEAVKRICRETGLARETWVPFVVPRGTSNTTLAASTGNELLRIIQVRYANVTATGVSLGTWNAATNTPTLTSASGQPLGSFYITSTPGSTNLNSGSNVGLDYPLNAWNTGDIVLSNGTTWDRYPLQKFLGAQEGNKPTKDWQYVNPQFQVGIAMSWTQENKLLFNYPTLMCDVPIEVTVSFVPSTDTDVIPLPYEAEECIVALSRYEAMCEKRGDVQTKDYTPEQRDMDLRERDRYYRQYKMLVSELRGIADYGYAGLAQYDPGTLEAGWP